MAINYVKFQRGSQEAYDALKEAGKLDENTLYFIYSADNSSVGALYMGNRIISGGDITIASANLDDLADVIVKGAGTNSFLVKGENNNWIAKSLEDVVSLIKNNLGKIVPDTQVFQAILGDSETDQDAINRVVGDSILAAGDIVIIKKLIANDKYQHTTYVYDLNNKHWVAMDGNYSAMNVFTTEDIQVTTEVGELTTDTIITAGTSVAELLQKVLSESKDPTKVEPKISTFSVTNNGSGSKFESGTSIIPKWSSVFDEGKYTYKSSVSNADITPVSGTGVNVLSWSILKNGTEISSNQNGTGEAFVIGDDTVLFKAIANYSAGNYALTNLNKLPEVEVRIQEGTAEATAEITSYRKMFAGSTNEAEITSDLIRSLEASAIADTSSFEFKANIGDTKLIFAYPSDLTTSEPKFEYFTMAWEPVGGFSKLDNIQVADARGGINGLKDYTVYVYAPASAYATETKYRVSF